MNRLLVLLLILAGGSTAQAQSCSREWVCVDVEDTAKTVRFYARNLKPWPLTLTLSVRGRGLSTRDGRTVTRTIPGSDRVLLSHFEVTGRHYDYSYGFDWTAGSMAPDQDSVEYRLPYAPGRSFRVLQGFGSRFSHTGREQYAVDFDMPVGTPVHAARGGVVVMVVEEHDRGCWQRGCGRFANYIVVLHEDGTTGEYYHLKKDGARVAEGDRVAVGQHIAWSGNTGHTTMPHLHFAVYRADTWGRTQSLPFRFRAARGLVKRPRAGQRYRAE